MVIDAVNALFDCLDNTSSPAPAPPSMNPVPHLLMSRCYHHQCHQHLLVNPRKNVVLLHLTVKALTNNHHPENPLLAHPSLLSRDKIIPHLAAVMNLTPMSITQI